eukprot:TRINITY_DN2274_c0_g1_i3.p2 TRINITY_DN2274_c0_g1~~TRINITY_DN2274_c0_g1_i3.p2  ORF type:complete len:163 (+),score=23.70 TRINITY_DN2274_c0_g1_i3:142-630(+)
MAVLQDDSLSCLNDCTGSCVEAFYMLHTYHELCQNLDKEAGIVYDDFEDVCEICDVGHFEEEAESRTECPTVDCSDLEDQKSLVELLSTSDCMGFECMLRHICIDAWLKLSSYHQTCPDDNLELSLKQYYNSFKESCPPECVVPGRFTVASETTSCDEVVTP